MNFKKLTSVVAAGVVAVTMVMPSATFAAGYGAELEGAYDWAYKNGVTTMKSIDQANMYGNLTRIAMAKMLSNYAINNLGKKPDTSIDCTFPDVSKEMDRAYDNGVTNACQLGIMWQGISKFDPNGTVTRGQFGTALSRLLWGDKNNVSENERTVPYYQYHLKALNKAYNGVTIMTDISNPNKVEVRGYVMLMLERSAGMVGKSTEECTAIQQLMCLLEENCTSACEEAMKDINKGEDNKEEEKKEDDKKSGKLTVNVEDHSSSVKSAPRGTILVAKIKLNPSESVDLDSISLKRTGLSSQTGIAHVRLEKNGVAVTNSATVSSDNLAVLNFKSNLADIEKAQTYDLIVEVASNAEAGAEFAFVIQDVKSSATAKINEDTTTTYRVGAYTVVNLVARAVAKQDDTIEYTVGNQKDYVIGEFSLESDSKKDDRDVNVKSITFRNMGSLDFEETFKNVKVYRDSKDVSSDIEINGKDITVSLGKDEITANKKAIYTIRAEVANLSEIDKNVQLQIRSIKDIIADESETEFRTTIEFDPTGDSLTLNSYKFKGGKITLEGDSSFAKSVNASTGASDVAIAKGTLAIAEPIELPTIKFDLTKDNNEDTYKAVKRITLDIDGRSYRADNQTGVFTFSDITVKKDADIKVLISLESKIASGVSKIVIPDLNNKLMEGSQGTYTNSDESFASTGVMGSIDTADVYVKAMKFSITTDTVNTQETVIKNSSTKTLMKGKFSVKDANVNINNLKVSLSDGITLDADESLEVYVYTNGESFSNGTITSTNTGFNFNSLGTISSDKDMSFEIRVKPYINTAKDITLSVIANGTTSDGNDTVSATETSATLEVKGNATIEVTTTSKTDRVVEPTSSVVIYEGELNVKNGSSTLNDFAITATAGSDITLKNYKLYVDGDIVATEDTPSFTALNENLEEGKRVIQVKADVTAAEWTDYQYDVTTVSINGEDYNKSTSTYFAKGFFNLSKTSTSDSVLTVKLTNNSPKTIDLKGLIIDGTFATASVNDQSVASDGSLTKVQTLAAGDSTEIQIIAAADQTAKLTGIVYSVTDGWKTYNYTITNAITAVAAWGNLYSTK